VWRRRRGKREGVSRVRVSRTPRIYAAESRKDKEGEPGGEVRESEFVGSDK